MDEKLREERIFNAVEEFKIKVQAILCKVEHLDVTIKENQISDCIAEFTNAVLGIKNKLYTKDKYVYLKSRMDNQMKTEIIQLVREFRNNILKIDNE